MAVAQDRTHAFVIELLGGCGPVTIKRMFGGAGVYAEGVMFALLANDFVHLKVDEALKGDLREQGSQPFIWTPASGPRAGESVDMGYWRMPEAALDDPEEAVSWARRAIAVAHAAAARKRPKAKRP